jgi:hypothetical protein
MTKNFQNSVISQIEMLNQSKNGFSSGSMGSSVNVIGGTPGMSSSS